MADAERLAQKLREDPRSPLFAAYAEALRKEGRDAEAWAALFEGQKHHPELASAGLVRARLHLAAGRWAVAAEILVEVLHGDAANDAARVTLVRILLDAGRKIEARHHGRGLANVASPEAKELLQRLVLPASPPTGDPFDAVWLVDRCVAGGDFRRALAIQGRAGGGERTADLVRASSGQLVAWIEAIRPRPYRALPYLHEVEKTLHEGDTP